MSKRKAGILVALLAAAMPLAAADASLGIITAKGPFKVNGATVAGNATLAEGAVIETAAAPSRLALTGGARLDLSAGAQAKVYKDRLVLKGTTDLTSAKNYGIEARSLRVSPVSADGSARVALRGGNTVQVAALKGEFRVLTASGILVSNVRPGAALDFEPQLQGPAVPSIVVGCLLKKDGKFIVFDQTANLTVELRGAGFDGEWGNRVQVNGTASAGAQPAARNVQVLDVTSVTRLEEGGCQGVASSIGAEAPGPPAQAPAPAKPAPAKAAPPKQPAPKAAGGGVGGMSAGTKVAIALVIAGGAGGAAAALAGGRSK